MRAIEIRIIFYISSCLKKDASETVGLCSFIYVPLKTTGYKCGYKWYKQDKYRCCGFR